MSSLRLPRGNWPLVALGGLLITALAMWQVSMLNRERLAAEVDRQATALVAEVSERFRLFEYGLRGARGAVLAGGAEGVRRATFVEYMDSRDMSREFAGARGFGFIRRVPAETVPAYLLRARADGAPEFSIRQLSPHDGDRFVIEFIYPLHVNQGATGLDIASERNRRQAALDAVRTGQVQLTAPITLVQADKKVKQGFLILLPVYQPGGPLNSPEARLQSALGWTYAPLVADEVMASVPQRYAELTLRLVDQGAAQPFFEANQQRSNGDAADLPSVRRGFTVYGRQWTLELGASTALAERMQLASMGLVGGVGALITLLLSLIARLVDRQGEQRPDPSGLGRGLWVFARGRLGRWSALALCGGCVMYGLVVAWQVRLAAVERVERELVQAVANARGDAEVAMRAQARGLLYLRGTPPVSGLVRSDTTGIDPRDGSTAALWRSRMAQIFQAYGSAHAEVLAVHLVRLGAETSPIVSWVPLAPGSAAASRTELRPADGPSELRDLTAKLREDRLWVQPVRRETAPDGRQLAVIRYLLPVYDRGQLFGALEVKVDAGVQLALSNLALPAGARMHVLDARQQWLGGTPLPESQGDWSAAYRSAPMPFLAARRLLSAWSGAEGEVVSATNQLDPNADGGDSLLQFRVAMPVSELETLIQQGWRSRMVLPAAVALALYLLLYLYWLSQRAAMLARSEQLRLGQVLDQSQEAVITLDAASRVELWSRGAVALFEIPVERAIGRPLNALLPDLVDAVDLAGWVRSRRSTVQLRTPDGGSRWLDIAASEATANGGRPGFALTLRDVTQDRQTSLRLANMNTELEATVAAKTQDLRVQRERLSNILSGTNAGTWEWNVQTGETRFNERWAEIIGYQLDELHPISIQTWLDHAHPEDLKESEQRLQAHFAGESAQYTFESRMRHKDGRWVWVLDRGRLMSRTADGQPEWMAGTHLDITDMKEAQLDLDRVATTLRSVLQAAVDFSIIATTPEGLITVFNRGAELMLGYTADEVVGRQTPALFHVAEEVQKRGAELSEKEGIGVGGFRVFVHIPDCDGIEQREWTYVRKDGRRLPVVLTVTPMRDASRRVTGYLGIAQDITERRAVERSLRHAKSAAEAASSAKSMFLANMSHEIRTPMNAVLGIAHLLQDSALNADQRQLLAKLQVAGRSLLGIINDVLDLAKIEAGELTAERLPYSPADLLEEVESLFADQARAKGLRWSLECPADLPSAFMGDAQRIRQVLTNLLSNAIKFTAHGSVQLSLAVVPDVDHRAWSRWVVRDSGIGIPADAQARLFQPFIQAESSTTRQFGGTGLGLSIVRRLAELMGGDVRLRSQPGEGSEFELWLPLELPGASEALPASNSVSALEVAVVDDEVDQLDRLVQVCSSFGWRTTAWSRAEDLLADLAQRRQRGVPLPEVLLMDWRLGEGLDGVSALRKLYQGGAAGALPAALLITQHERNGLNEQELAGMGAALLTKPVLPSTLFNAVNEAIAARHGRTDRLLQATRLSRVKAQMLPGVSVLVVDDSEINLEVAQRMLARHGALVVCESHAEGALARLRDDPNFDLVLMDIQMPGMDGYEATRRIRQELRLSRLPVIALTAGALDEERRRALAAGMSDFLTKPLDPENLVRTLRRHVESTREEPLPVASGSVERGVPDDWPVVAGIELADAYSRLDGDRSLFLRLLRQLVAQYNAAWLAQLQASLQEGPTAAASQMHKLRGSAGVVGANAVCELAAQAETALRAAAPDMTALEHGLAAVGGALETLCNAVAALPPEVADGNAAPASTAGNGEVDKAMSVEEGEKRLLALHELLRIQDTAAGDAFRDLRPWLTAQGMSADEQRRIDDWVQDLDYEPAVAALRQWRNR